MLFSSFSLLFVLPLARSLSLPTRNEFHDGHTHESDEPLPGTWYHEPDHPVHSLFRRAAPGDGTDYAAVGTPQWSAGFPAAFGPPDPALLPQAWVNAYNAAVAAGKIPNIPQSTTTPGVNPVYPQGINPNSPDVCSATYKCRIPGDIWDSPDGVFASAFDDGPTGSTPALVQFLTTNNLKTTHFMIGVTILQNPVPFSAAFDAGHDIAVHTWSHPYMTTLSSLDIVGQLGWTIQLIHNSTGGRVPRYWRPPYGDSDQRVRAIALEVFGLTTAIWNQDTEDWSESTPAPIQAAMTRFLTMPKSPGLIILEHELTDVTVNGFINSFPMIAQNGWSFRSLAEVMSNGTSYQNAASSTSSVTAKGVLANSPVSSSTTTSSSSTSAPSTSGTTSAQNLQPSKTSAAFKSNVSSRVLFSCFLLSTALVFLS